MQHIPILRENWVISMRARLETTLDDDDQVPTRCRRSAAAARCAATAAGASAIVTPCCSPASGGGPSRMALDMAFFYDTGMVAPRLDAITFGSFVSDSASACGFTRRR